MGFSTKKSVRFDASIYRLVISNIVGYGTFQPPISKGSKRTPNLSSALDSLKQQVLDYLLQQQFKRKVKPTHWSVAWQIHPASGLPHLDLLIVFQSNIRPLINSFDYLIKDLQIKQKQADSAFKPGHVWVTAYSPKKLNQAILDYGFKEDPSVISNLSTQNKQQIIALNLLKADPYLYLQKQMLKDPLHFNLQQYVRIHNLDPYIIGWSSIKTKLKDMQLAAANLTLKDKPGFRYIDRPLIESRLSSDELVLYDSWSGYQTIVDYLNQIVTYGNRRQMKTLNLLITGPASIGKTTLFHNPNHRSDRACVQDYIAVYPMGMSTWFPQYRSGVYKLILWNQAKLTSYSYDVILKLLEGSYLDLPTKGGIAPKRDNPLIVMTSNMTLQQMIKQKFGYNNSYVDMARANLAVRVQNLIVPPGYKLFLIQKLLCPI